MYMSISTVCRATELNKELALREALWEDIQAYRVFKVKSIECKQLLAILVSLNLYQVQNSEHLQYVSNYVQIKRHLTTVLVICTLKGF